MDIRFSRSARRHRIGAERVRAAIEDAGEPEHIPAAKPGERDTLLWIGRDARGVELEIIAIEIESGTLLVIHAMPTHYRRRRD